MTEIKQATRDLSEAVAEGRRVIAIHYSCENFNNVTDRPAAISAIGIAEVTDPSGEYDARVFSIANSAENEDAIEREKEMFDRFMEYAKDQLDVRWVHWNMNNAIYGFSALIARYRYLFHKDAPDLFPAERLYDLDSIVGARYGESFAQHPKFKSLCRHNKYFMTQFVSGAEEAKAFEDGNYGVCERSSAEKAHLLVRVLTSFLSGSLQTANSVGILHFADSHLDAVKVVLAIGDRTVYVARELAHRHSARDTLVLSDEYDAQDLMRSLLTIFFNDIRPEEHTPSYAGATSRIDFVLPEFQLAIELKFTRPTLTDKKLGEELIVDRERYAKNKDVRHLLCLVFDRPEAHLRNPRGLERDLSRSSSTESFAVTVKIYDR